MSNFSIKMYPPILPELEGEKTVAEILMEDFPSTVKYKFPIDGYWGYKIENPVIFRSSYWDERPSMSFVDIEYIFIQKRTYEELIIYRPKGMGFSRINIDRTEQNLIEHDGRTFDELFLTVTALPDSAFEFLKDEYTKNNFFENNPEGMREHEKKLNSLTVEYHTRCYFDITEVFGDNKYRGIPDKGSTN